MERPNSRVSLVFEAVGTGEEDVAGCRVFLETPSRPITEEILVGKDVTVPELWATEIFEFVRSLLVEKWGLGHVTMTETNMKKEDMN